MELCRQIFVQGLDDRVHEQEQFSGFPLFGLAIDRCAYHYGLSADLRARPSNHEEACHRGACEMIAPFDLDAAPGIHWDDLQWSIERPSRQSKLISPKDG